MAARRLTVPTCEAGEKIVGPFVDCAKALVGSASKAQTRSTRDEYDMGRWGERSSGRELAATWQPFRVVHLTDETAPRVVTLATQ